MNLGGDWSLTTGQRQLPVTVAWAMAGVLSGMLGADILLLDSWLEQKGVDGFSLSVSSFNIQQIRVAGCCGDNSEQDSRTPAPQIEPASVDLGHPEGGSFCYGKHNNNNNNKKSKGERKEEMKEGEKKGGNKGRKYTTSSSNDSAAL